MFETFDVPCLMVETPGVLSLYAAGKSDGVVVDCGNRLAITAVPLLAHRFNNALPLARVEHRTQTASHWRRPGPLDRQCTALGLGGVPNPNSIALMPPGSAGIHPGVAWVCGRLRELPQLLRRADSHRLSAPAAHGQRCGSAFESNPGHLRYCHYPANHSPSGEQVSYSANNDTCCPMSRYCCVLDPQVSRPASLT